MSGDPGHPASGSPSGGDDPEEGSLGFDAIWEWDLRSEALQWERGLGSQFGYDEVDVEAAREWWGERVHPDDRDRVGEELAAALETRRSWESEFRFRRADGSHVRVYLRVAIVRSDGEAERLVGTMVDVDERRRTRRALREMNERYRTLVEQNLVGISLSYEGEFVHVNPRLAEIHGYDREALLRTDPIELLPEGPRDEVLADVYRLAEGEVDEATVSGPVTRPDGETAHIESYLRRIDYRGEEAFLTVTMDVTDQVEAERARERQAAALEDERARLDFLNAMLRHHVLNGMNIVLATAEHLAADAGDEQRARLATIRDRGKAIVDLVQTIRSLVRTIRTGEEEGFDAVDLAATLERSVGAAAAAHGAATVRLEEPAAGEDLHVRADAMLGTVFDELLENAVVHGGAGPTVDVEVEPEGETVSVHVADDGPGVPETVRENLFDEATTTGGGGFGLNVVHLLVTLYGGSMRIEERDPGGTVVTVTLRRAAPEGAEE